MDQSGPDASCTRRRQRPSYAGNQSGGTGRDRPDTQRRGRESPQLDPAGNAGGQPRTLSALRRRSSTRPVCRGQSSGPRLGLHSQPDQDPGAGTDRCHDDSGRRPAGDQSSPSPCRRGHDHGHRWGTRLCCRRGSRSSRRNAQSGARPSTHGLLGARASGRVPHHTSAVHRRHLHPRSPGDHRVRSQPRGAPATGRAHHVADDHYLRHGAGTDLHRPISRYRADEAGRVVSGDVDGGDGDSPHRRSDAANAAAVHRRRYRHHSHPVPATGVSDDARQHTAVEHRCRDLRLGLGPNGGGPPAGVQEPVDGAEESPPGAQRHRHHLPPRAPPAGRGGTRDTPGLLPRSLAPRHGDRARGRILPPRTGRDDDHWRPQGLSLRHCGRDVVPPSCRLERKSGAAPDPGPPRDGTDSHAPGHCLLPRRRLVADHLRGAFCAHGDRGRGAR